MGAEENENQAVSLTSELPSEDTQEEPIEQVMTRDTTDSGAAEYSDQEAFEETAKVEEVEPEPLVSTRQTTTRNTIKPHSKLISDFDNRLKRYTEAGKKTDMTIKVIQRKIKDLDKRTSTKHHQVIRDLQAQVKQLQTKIERIERSLRSKSVSSANKPSSKKNKKKSKKTKRR